MAPAFDEKDGRFSLGMLGVASGAGTPAPHPWTTGDDSDEGIELETQKRHRERRSRRRHGARREIPTVTSTFGVGIQTVPSSETTSVQLSGAPAIISATVTDGVGPSPAPSLGNVPPPLLPAVDSDDSGPDSESEDESSTLAPTSTSAVGGSGTSLPHIGTATGPLSVSSTGSFPDGNAPADAALTARQRHHRSVETALTVVGSVAGVVCIGVAMWLLYRLLKRRRDRLQGVSTPKRSRRARFLAHVPAIKTRFGSRSWFNMHDPYVDERDPRFIPGNDDDLLGYLPNKPPPAAVPQMRTIHADEAGYYNTATTMHPADAHQGNGGMPSPDEAPDSPTETPLSSAFGNGTYMAPAERRAPPTERRPEEDLPPPPPVALYRDTVYTESSEASSAPRFRTVNSWVRHQNGRVQRVPPPPVPEQGYGFMMPDGEEARRVVVAPQGVGYAT